MKHSNKNTSEATPTSLSQEMPNFIEETLYEIIGDTLSPMELRLLIDNEGYSVLQDRLRIPEKALREYSAKNKNILTLAIYKHFQEKIQSLNLESDEVLFYDHEVGFGKSSAPVLSNKESFDHHLLYWFEEKIRSIEAGEALSPDEIEEKVLTEIDALPEEKHMIAVIHLRQLHSMWSFLYRECIDEILYSPESLHQKSGAIDHFLQHLLMRMDQGKYDGQAFISPLEFIALNTNFEEFSTWLSLGSSIPSRESCQEFLTKQNIKHLYDAIGDDRIDQAQERNSKSSISQSLQTIHQTLARDIINRAQNGCPFARSSIDGENAFMSMFRLFDTWMLRVVDGVREK